MSQVHRPALRWGLRMAAAIGLVMVAHGVTRLDAQAAQGIVVHGHWVIDVRQPGGALVTHREFENALDASGGAEIAGILAGRRVPGSWAINLISDRGNSPCTSPALILPCRIFEPGWVVESGSHVFTNLTRSPTGLVIKGTATAGRAGSIDYVVTNLFSCSATVPVPACATYGTVNPGSVSNWLNFSGTVVSPPVDAVANQLIQVEVIYTFSAGGTTVVE